jgi:hypothetical protein
MGVMERSGVTPVLSAVHIQNTNRVLPAGLKNL